MFLIDKEKNEAISISKKTFQELEFKERKHLQEWISKNTDILGERLLIIQKEFSGFDDTKERLDLLALDESGNLVIIENKLDDSGRDVVWQALKYASYCSSLTKNDIKDIFQNISLPSETRYIILSFLFLKYTTQNFFHSYFKFNHI
jgi:RecB family endonuclease NucS